MRPFSESPSRSNFPADPIFVRSNYHPGRISSRSPAKVEAALMSRRQKRLYLPQPAPRILHLPSRSVRRAARPGKGDTGGGSAKENLGTLFERERRFRNGEGCVVIEEAGEGVEAWRFQEEVLRAECNVLRMEREIAVKKLRRSRLSAEKILRSAIQALVDGRRRIAGGMDIQSVIDEEIGNIVGKLGELRRKTRGKESEGGRNCSNFDTQVAVLQKRLEKLRGVGIPNNSSREIMSTQCEGDDDEDSGDCKVELLRRKMEGLSKDVLLEKMIEEYGSMLSSSKRIEWPLPQSVLTMGESNQTVTSGIENVCSGHCRAVVRRVIEQVRSETEQWAQIPAMLGQLRDEMEELQVSRDFWEDHALDNDHRIRSLSSAVREWRQRAVQSETKVNELQGAIAKLREEVERLRNEEEEEERRPEISRQMVQGEMEKKVLICHLRENRRLMETERRLKENFMERRRKVHTTDVNADGSSRFPFKDIGNLSPQSVKNALLP